MSEVKFNGVVDGAKVDFSAFSEIEEAAEAVFARMMRFTPSDGRIAPDTRAAVAKAEIDAVARGRREAFDAVSAAFVNALTKLGASDPTGLDALIGVTVRTTETAARLAEIVPRSTDGNGPEISMLGVVNAALRAAGAQTIAVDVVREKPSGNTRTLVRVNKGV